MNIYQIEWKIIDGGEYVPPDPCCGGDYYSDLYGQDFMTTKTKKNVYTLFTKANPHRKIIKVTLLGRA